MELNCSITGVGMECQAQDKPGAGCDLHFSFYTQIRIPSFDYALSIPHFCCKGRGKNVRTRLERLLGEAIVFFQGFAEAIVRESDDGVTVDASHSLGSDHGV